MLQRQDPCCLSSSQIYVTTPAAKPVAAFARHAFDDTIAGMSGSLKYYAFLYTAMVSEHTCCLLSHQAVLFPFLQVVTCLPQPCVQTLRLTCFLSGHASYLLSLMFLNCATVTSFLLKYTVQHLRRKLCVISGPPLCLCVSSMTMCLWSTSFSHIDCITKSAQYLREHCVGRYPACCVFQSGDSCTKKMLDDVLQRGSCRPRLGLPGFYCICVPFFVSPRGVEKCLSTVLVFVLSTQHCRSTFLTP